MMSHTQEELTARLQENTKRSKKEKLAIIIDKAIGHRISNENILCTDSWRHLKHMLLKREWLFTNSSPMVRFVQRGFITSRT